MFGLTVEKVVVIAVIAAFLLGPERLPGLAQQLGALVRKLKGFTGSAEQKLKNELGPEFAELDWHALDPRQFDPRRIIREALLEEPAAPTPVAAAPTPVLRRAPLNAPATPAAE